jgi:high affinity sulfate transporter 1
MRDEIGGEEKMTTATEQKTSRRIPFMQGVLPIDRAQLPAEIIAGVTLAALAIPEVMGYTKIAGMPVVTGLYTILIPMVLYGLFGSSRHLVVGADSATAAIMAAGLVGLATASSPEYIAYAGILALMAAGLLILARLIKLGFIADFLSRTVLIGFLTGVGIQVAIGQISGMLGIPGGGSGPVQKLVTDVQQLGQVNSFTLGISLAVIIIIEGSKRINKKIPGALIAVIGSIILGSLIDLPSHGVAVLGAVPGGLPKIGLPTGVTLKMSTIIELLSVAISMFIVILAQSAATSRAYAARYNETFSENVDLVGLGLANIGAGISGTFVVNGSPTKTQMVDSAGGRSQLATLITSAIVLIVLLFLTKPLAFMPDAVLATVVFLVGYELIDIKGMRKIFLQRPDEFWVALITAVIVVFIGVKQGIIVAMILSILVHIRYGYKPQNAVLGVNPSGRQGLQPVSSHAEAQPGLMIYRFHHSLYYANAEFFSQEVSELVNQADPPLKWFCLDAVAINDIDFTAAAVLRETCKLLKEKDIRFVTAEATNVVRKEMERMGVTGLMDSTAHYTSLEEVEKAYFADLSARSNA